MKNYPSFELSSVVAQLLE